jgi:cystathionine beta-synthase
MNTTAVSAAIDWVHTEGGAPDWDAVTGGWTPVVEFRHPLVHLLAKLEYLQPGGSVKSRIALPLIRSLIDAGTLTSSTRYVVEATGGNTAYALVDALRAVGSTAKVLAVMTSKIDEKKAQRLQSAGVLVHRIPYVVGPPDERGLSPFLAATAAVAESMPGSVLAGQFTAKANPLAHQVATAQEIMAQVPEPPDAVVLGAGSGGTLMGLSRAFKEAGYATRIVLADPEGSVIGPAFRGEQQVPRKTVVQGIGGDVLPPLLDLNRIDEAVTIPDSDSIRVWRQLRESGFAVGLSSACAVAAALRWSAESRCRRRCLVLFADHGSRYDDRYPV